MDSPSTIRIIRVAARFLQAGRPTIETGSAQRVASRFLQASRIDAPPAMLKAITAWVQAQMATEVLREAERLREKSKRPGRWEELADFLGEDYAADSLVDLAETERLAKRFGGKAPSGSKPKEYKRDFPLDLSGWRHEAHVEKLLDQSGRRDWVYRMISPVTVIWTSPRHAPPRVKGPGGTPKGTWDSIGLLRLFMGIPPIHPDHFTRRMKEVARVLRHELQHLSQTVLQDATEHAGAGMPSRGKRDRSSPHDVPEGTSGEHALRDTEFYTRLQDDIDEFNRLRGRFGPASDKAAQRKAIRVWIGELPAQGIGQWEVSPSAFFSALKRFDRKKWRKAVGEFVAAVG